MHLLLVDGAAVLPRVEAQREGIRVVGHGLPAGDLDGDELRLVGPEAEARGRLDLEPAERQGELAGNRAVEDVGEAEPQRRLGLDGREKVEALGSERLDAFDSGVADGLDKPGEGAVRAVGAEEEAAMVERHEYLPARRLHGVAIEVVEREPRAEGPKAVAAGEGHRRATERFGRPDRFQQLLAFLGRGIGRDHVIHRRPG